MPQKIPLMFVLAISVWGGAARAQAPVPYGLPLNLDDAKKAVAAAEAEAKNITPTPYVIAVVDPGGHLIYFEREDNAQLGSIRVAIDKARSAATAPTLDQLWIALAGVGPNCRPPAVLSGNLALRGAVALEGGLPLVAGGKIVGAIGASGGTGAQDGQVAKAGADTVK